MKATGTKKSNHAQAAAAIRAALKANFPGQAFKVTSRWIDVSIGWNDGPTEDEVLKVTSPFAYGEFDGSDDSYKYSNLRNDVPQVKYIMTYRSITKASQVAEMMEEYRANIKNWSMRP